MSTTLEFNKRYQEILRLPGGERIKVRLVRRSDKERLHEGFSNLSATARQKRFLGMKPSISDAELRYFTDLDHHDHFAIGAVELDLLGGEHSGVAVGRFVRLAPDSDCAEVAITVIDRMQRKGIGRMLLEKLVKAAAERDIHRFRFDYLSHNHEIRKLVRRVFRTIEIVHDDSSITSVEVDLSDHFLAAPQVAVEQFFVQLHSCAADSLKRQVRLATTMATWTREVTFKRWSFWLEMYAQVARR